MYGFPNSKCKIDGCNKLVWPSRVKGYCNTHYQRDKRGRMNPDGSLSQELFKITCQKCGNVFEDKRVGNVKWCHDCRPGEYLEIINDNIRGVYRRGKREESPRHKEKLRVQYLTHIADWFDSSCEKLTRAIPLVKMKQQGKTLQEISDHAGVSRERVRQLIRDVSA